MNLICIRLSAVLVALSAAALAAQAPPASAPHADRTFCVVPRDTGWRPADFGYDLRVEVRIGGGRGTRWTYPTIANVRTGSPADSAGVLDGDQLIEINGQDLVARRDSAHVPGPNIPTPLKFKRGDSTFSRTITPTAARECKRNPT